MGINKPADGKCFLRRVQQYRVRAYYLGKTSSTEHIARRPSAWNPARASFATLMTEPLTIESILKSTDWIDSRFILPEGF